MRRRQFIAVIGGAAAAWPLAALAQPTEKVFHLGYLSSYSAESGKAFLACFQDGLRELGWIEGKNIRFDYRWSGGSATPMPALAAELVSLHPDLIMVASTPGTQAVHKATKEIPVVFAGVSDPVASGIVATIPHPGGNITGVSNFLPATSGKLIELLRAVLPTATRFAVLRDPNNAGKQLELAELKQASQDIGVTLEAVDASAVNDIDDALASIGRMNPDALITLLDGVTFANRYHIADWATKHRLPAVYQIKDYVIAGGLMSYGLNYCRHYRSAAAYVDKILRGAKPADLPVELPTTFELIINLKAAKAIGLTIPESFLVLADEVIE